jgi:bifunctional DNase/RNase
MFQTLPRGHLLKRSLSADSRAAARLVFWRLALNSVDMKKDVLPVAIRGILPANSGCAIFVGNDEKVFVIQVEHNMGAIIGMFLRETPKERPLTHDLMNSVLKGFGISVERVIITELKNSTYFARLILQQQNELGRKLVEIDARPSDCLALAAAQKRPIFVSQSLFEQVEDMSEVLERINENDSENENETDESEGEENK